MAKTQNFITPGIVHQSKNQDTYGFHLERWLKKALKSLNVSFFDECCEDQAVETLVANGAISLSKVITNFDTTDGPIALTLADGSQLQEKIITLTVDGGDVVITPANLAVGTTITLEDVGDLVKLQFINGAWVVIVNTGATIA